MAKSIQEMTPDERISLIRRKIRELFGNDVEDKSRVTAAHGRYYVRVPVYLGGETQVIRWWQIPGLLKMLKERAADR